MFARRVTPVGALILLALACAPVLVADAAPAAGSADAAALKALGATVTEAEGVIRKVEFRDCSKLGEAEFRLIGKLKDLKTLTLYGGCAGLNDTTAPLLAGLTSLEELSTEGVQLSDDGLKHLATLTNLRSLAFFHISLKLKGFTGAGFAHLKPLAKLERL